jgi:guanylate kinase
MQIPAHELADARPHPRLAVLSGPGGVGKSTVVRALREILQGWSVSVSATTRASRPGERDGIDYHFVTDEQFDRMIAEGAFLEWANFGGNRYGTLWSSVREPLAAGRSVLLEIEIQGALAVKKEFPDAVLLFLHPPSFDVLQARLRDRGTDDPERVRERLALAEWELAQSTVFDHQVTNDDVDAAAVRIAEILRGLDSSEPYTG